MQPRIGYIITSNKLFVDKTINPILESMSYINANKITVVIGRCDVKFHEKWTDSRLDHIDVFETDVCGFENTGLISLIEDFPDDYDYVFNLHDTCKVGPRFEELVESVENGFDPTADLTILDTHICGFAMYNVSYLKSQSDFLQTLRHIDKTTAVKNERSLSERANKVASYPKGQPQILDHGSSDVYGGVPRITEYWPQVDLYKYKANWNDAVEWKTEI